MGNKQKWVEVDEKFKNVRVRSLSRTGTFHDQYDGEKRGKNGIWVVDFDGLTLVHMGDIGHELSAAQIKAIGKVDILMIPVGGIYTVNGSEAKLIVEQLKPRLYVFPMHYGTKVYDFLATPEEFLEGNENVRKKLDTNEISFNSDLKLATPETVILGWTK